MISLFQYLLNFHFQKLFEEIEGKTSEGNVPIEKVVHHLQVISSNNRQMKVRIRYDSILEENRGNEISFKKFTVSY